MESLLLNVNKNRLIETINGSSSIGSTENEGLSRLALTEEDKKMRNLFVEWLHEAGLQVRVDDFGNIYGRREGRIKEGPVVAIGSHLDTQPCGGRFDGILGVLASLEVIRVLNENNIITDYPIEVVNFTNEEGARFRPPMLGSGGVAEVFTKELIYSTKDDDGVTFEEALKEIGYMGEEKHRISNVKNYIELHIEQGPILDIEDISIGIVEGIQGMSWLNVNVIGETNHAGPTPMENRKDALIPASKMIVKVNELTKEIEGLKTTVGKVKVIPNVTNVVPGAVEFSIDLRHQDDAIRVTAIERLTEQLYAIAAMDDVEIEMTTAWSSDAVDFSKDVRDAIKEAAVQFEYSSLELYSGPGHDSKYMNNLAKSGMIFVKSINGISHNEQELTSDEDIIKGANVLLYVVQKLANKA